MSPNERFTDGLRISSIPAALADAVLLFVACGAIGWESFGESRRRLPPSSMGGLLRESAHKALDVVPPNIDVAAVEEFLKSRLSVADLHDLHIGGTSTTQSALTVHLVMPDRYPGDVAMDRITRTLTDRFSFDSRQHASGRRGRATDHTCPFAPGDCGRARP